MVTYSKIHDIRSTSGQRIAFISIGKIPMQKALIYKLNPRLFLPLMTIMGT